MDNEEEPSRANRSIRAKPQYQRKIAKSARKSESAQNPRIWRRIRGFGAESADLAQNPRIWRRIRGFGAKTADLAQKLPNPRKPPNQRKTAKLAQNRQIGAKRTVG
jgi:hypothetical protein